MSKPIFVRVKVGGKLVSINLLKVSAYRPHGIIDNTTKVYVEDSSYDVQMDYYEFDQLVDDALRD